MTAARHTLPPLPYAMDALAPTISARTLDIHHGKHHAGYVEALNKLVAGTHLADMSLDEVITASVGRADRVAIFNNAAQAWNHAFYWQSLRPHGAGTPPAALKALIDSAFGGLQGCHAAIAEASAKRFGSGWVWLVEQAGALAVVHTANADQPSTPAQRPLLVIDVWEHAYYLDCENRRADHVNAVLGGVINWGFAADNLARSAHTPAHIPAHVPAD